jgi:hypothetical protein
MPLLPSFDKVPGRPISFFFFCGGKIVRVVSSNVDFRGQLFSLCFGVANGIAEQKDSMAKFRGGNFRSVCKHFLFFPPPLI